MTKAAAQLRVSPTALSLQIRLLEERSGHKLLERHSRGVRVTAIGQILFERSKQIMRIVGETETELSAHIEEQPRVRIGMPPSAMRSLGYDCLEARHTGGISCEIELREIQQNDLRDRLTGGEIDLAVGFEMQSTPEVHVVKILEERLVLIAPPTFESRGASVSLAEVLATHLIMYSQEGVFWNMVKRAAVAHRLEVPEPEIIGSVDVIVHLVAGGRGATIASRNLVEEELARGELRAIEIEGAPLHRSWCLAINQTDRSEPALASLMEELSALVRRRHTHRGSIYSPA